MNDRFQDLRTFVAVVQGRGFASGAERLGLVKSAVSRRVRELEERLGTRLLQRTTRAISLTDAGGEFYWRAVRILADLDEAEGLAASGTQDASGRVRATAPAALVTRRLAGCAGELLQRHPRLVLELHAEDTLVDIVGGGYDLAFRIGPLEDSSLVARRVASIPYLYVATSAYLEAHGRPTSRDGLRDHRRISHVNAEGGREAYPRIGSPDEARLVLDSEEAILAAVLAGGGVAELPDYLVAPELASGALEPLMAATDRPVHALFPSNRNVPAKVRTVIDFVVGRCALDGVTGNGPRA